MDQQKWKKINGIVDAALKFKGEKRSTFIQQKCRGDRELLHQVTTLLKAIEQSETKDFLEGFDSLGEYLASNLSDETKNTYTSSLIGETIGKYQITELIGYGGMGSVFMAERADGAYNNTVALKIMRRGMDTPSNNARFRRERDILARLNHPNIARLLDGGVTADGLPYFVMEYVQGTPLIEYCNKNQLSVEERLNLFKIVCTAVRYAHRNAIIHRDLKPSNIYVTDDGVVKILDFGIAKLTESNNSDIAFFQTRTGARILTLGYAAPEQFKDETITTATDSYTLGTLLYKLLAGVHPFDIAGKSFAATEEIICNHIPLRPSEQFAQLSKPEKTEIATQRGTVPSNLTQQLKGDLDAIVLKALRKEPEARYQSVEQMLEDLNRHEQSRPLIAQKDTFRYRFKKFVSRNYRSVIAAILIFTAVLGFGSYHINQVTEERNIAERETQKAETVKNFLVNIFGSSNPGSSNFEGRDVSAKELLLNGKDKLTQELHGQPDVYTEILIAIGDALGNIDAFEEAEKSYRQALSKASESSAPLENKIKIHVKLGHLTLTWKRNEHARPLALKAQSLLNEIKNPPTGLEASVFGLLGKVISVADNYKEGNKYFEKADSLYKSAGMQNSDDYIQMLTEYGRSLLYVFDFKKSEEILIKSNNLHRQKYNKPTLTIAENYKFIAWTNREMGNFERSNHYFQKSIELKKELTGPESIPTAKSIYHLARNHALIGNFSKSEKLAQKVLSIYQKKLQSPNNFIHQAKNYVAIAKYNQNKLDEARKLFKNIISERREMKTDNKMYLAGVMSHLAVVYQKTGIFQDAVSLLEESIQINEKNLGAESRGVAVDMIKLASVYREMGDYKKGQEYFSQAESILKEETPENHYRRGELYLQFGKLERDTNNFRKAQKCFNKAYNIYLDIFGEDSNRTREAESLLKNIAQA